MLLWISLRPFRAEQIYPIEKTVLRENLATKIPAREQLNDLIRAASILPNDSHYLALLGKYYLFGDKSHERKANLKKAEYYFKKSLEANPTYTEAISYLGWIDFATGHPMRGVEKLDRAIRISGHNFFHRIMFFRAVTRFERTLPPYLRKILIARAAIERLEAIRLNPALRTHPWARRPRVNRATDGER